MRERERERTQAHVHAFTMRSNIGVLVHALMSNEVPLHKQLRLANWNQCQWSRQWFCTIPVNGAEAAPKCHASSAKEKTAKGTPSQPFG
eukprot:1150587-Pelagomonas_calceolata.AAC.3